MRIILGISQVQRGKIVLFSKGKLSSPLLPSYSDYRRRHHASDGATCRWSPPYPRAAPFAAGAATPRVTAPAGIVPVVPLQVLPTPAGASHAHGRPRLLATALATGGLAMAGHPWRWPGLGRPPLLATFPTKMQQEYVE
ncbi:hypothetical protein B296_00029774 [Ensete ventricosum]|uniref:Uncharacterized protein n=1 Tax=Ensete ventricosum TaxID=4639 RepID=A0A426Y6I4_ENSVE|nr:hypothetical protein B296_00029774 [Ensete ventricosum]